MVGRPWFIIATPRPRLRACVFHAPSRAMWSSLRLNGQDVPDGWHRYAVRGGDDGWEPCSIEPFVWVNHTADIITPVDLELDKHDRMLTIRDWWFDDEPFPAE